MHSTQEQDPDTTTDDDGAEHESSRDARPPKIDFGRLARLALDQITDQVAHHPLRTVAVAAGVGYVLGRGVPAAAVRLGMVMVARIATEAVITSTIEPLLRRSPGGEDDSDAQPHSEVPNESVGTGRRANGRFGRRTPGVDTSAEVATHE